MREGGGPLCLKLMAWGEVPVHGVQEGDVPNGQNALVEFDQLL